jgi:hypothetical protein
MKRARTLYSQI